MWRLVVVTFAFLAWAFYALSGGANYQPSEGSLQARTKNPDEPLLAVAEPVKETKVPAMKTTGAKPSETKEENAQASLNDVQPSDDGKVVMTAVQFGDNGVKSVANDSAIQAAMRSDKAGDLRVVNGNNVNLRSGPGKDFGTVDKLNEGTKVMVLREEAGWVELRVVDSNTQGWMADWLVTAANN